MGPAENQFFLEWRAEQRDSIMELRTDVKLIRAEQGTQNIDIATLKSQMDEQKRELAGIRWAKRAAYTLAGTGIVDLIINHWGKH